MNFIHGFSWSDRGSEEREKSNIKKMFHSEQKLMCEISKMSSDDTFCSGSEAN